MNYRRFTTYNISGAVLWVGSCGLAGYLFGNIPIVRDNFSIVVLGIIAVSLIPGAVALVRARMSPAA
jgi:membrane-associated protein